MSSRAHIVCHGPVEIYECVNSWDELGNFHICIAALPEQWKVDDFYGDVVITRKELREIYNDLKKFFNRIDSKKGRSDEK